MAQSLSDHGPGLRNDNTDLLPPYQYAPLRNPTEDIRIVKLHPGSGDSPLELQIIERQLVDAIPKRPSFISPAEFKAVEESLPVPWQIRQTEEGRLIYVDYTRKDLGYPYTSWTHPTRSDIDTGSVNYDDPHSLAEDEDHDPTNKPSYEALSYTWGNALELQATIVRNDALSTRFVFKVSKQLTEALRHLRSQNTSRNLWIDAICINQNDIMERNAQVRRMGSIFAQARRVVAWLGPSYESSQFALETVKHMGEQVQAIQPKKTWLPTPECTHPEWCRSHIDLPHGQDTIKSIYRLIQLPWFERMWIVQEILLGSPWSMVKCGNDEVRWAVFRRGIDLLFQKHSGSRSGITHTTALCAHRPAKLDELMHRFYDRRCRDDRDRLYALLHLFPPRTALALREDVDYALPVLETYKRTTLHSIDITQTMDILRHSPYDHDPASPSWVMDWRRRSSVSDMPGKGFSAGGFSACRSRYIAPDKLEVSGVLVGSVLSTEKLPVRSFNDVIDYLRTLDIKALGKLPYSTRETRLRAYLLTLLESDVFEAYIRSKPRKPRQKEFEDAMVQMVLNGEEVSDNILRPRAKAQIERRCWDAHAIVLDNAQKHIGKSQVPPNEGDVVLVPLGCEMPLLLRPDSDRTGHYRLMGECYIHGIMFGEAFLGQLPYPWCAKRHKAIPPSWRTCFQRSGEDNDKYSLKDPRLKDIPMPEDWTQVRNMKEETFDDPRNFVGEFRHRTTGEVIKGDPRMLPEALAERGIRITTVTLV
ncbi:heterokaryon incompatibility protein-domain-containing protein [Podospora fimiseda]|uniref:Heterokaryon incompatibility protein-domain-containing protein n=1 Tax=Podospora fimiseda TaxID=252190 RepID=A0AAN7BKW6_9PEZI|nr:heterokaryon incompatibility protein-domain-containing protein [Podospora fimiseda]